MSTSKKVENWYDRFIEREHRKPDKEDIIAFLEYAVDELKSEARWLYHYLVVEPNEKFVEQILKDMDYPQTKKDGMSTSKRVELKNKLEELSAINYNLYIAGTIERADTGEDWTYDQALDELVDFITQHHQDLMSEVVERFMELDGTVYNGEVVVRASDVKNIIKSK